MRVGEVNRPSGDALREKRRHKKITYVPKSPKVIRAIARDLRARLGIDDKFAPDLAHILNRLTEVYPKFRYRVVEDGDLPDMEAKAYSKAFMLKVRQTVMNALRTYGDPRSRFTIAHELGHLLLGHPGNQPRARRGETIRSAQDLLEHEANLFASEFLIPSHLYDPSLSAGDTSRLFQVSIDVATLRAPAYGRGVSNHNFSSHSRNFHTPKPDVGSETQRSMLAAFVSMAFTPEMNRLYLEILKPTIESVGLTCTRGDEIPSINIVATDIERALDACTILVAEISTFNPNVMHEIGLAQRAKPVILICRSGYRDDEIPFNIRHLRRLVYENDAAGGLELRRKLDTTLREFLRNKQI